MSQNTEAETLQTEQMSEPNVHDWHDLDPASVRAGDTVTGFVDLTELDVFTDSIGHWVTNNRGGHLYRSFNPDIDFHLSNSGKKVYRGWHASSNPPSTALRPKNFFGKFDDISVMPMDDFDSLQRGEYGKADFIVTADMMSSGRGVKGRIAQMVTVKAHTPSVGYAGVLTVSYKKLPSDNAEKAAEKLNLEADKVATKVIINGLRRAYSGGLPGHGRRR